MTDRMFLSRLPLFQRFPLDDMRGLWRFAMRRLDQERLPQVAGSLTLTTVLALVPMLTVAFAIFTTFPMFNTFRASLEAYFIKSVMPKGIANTILGNLNQFANKATRLSAVGAIGLILTTLIMMMTIDRAFNHIWRVKSSRPFHQRLVVYWAIMTLGPLLIGVSISVTSHLLTATSGVVSSVPFFGAMAYTVISVTLTTVAFTLLYIVVPNRFVDWRDAAAGGLLAAVAFEIAKRAFVVFITQFPTYTVIYGALAALPIFLLWVYVSWLLTLMGAVLAAALPVVKYERWWHEASPGSAFIEAMAILEVLHDARAEGATASVDARTIRDRTRLGFDESESLLQRMLDAGWVGRIKAETPKRSRFGKRIIEGKDNWVLLINPEKLKVADVYRLFVFNTASNELLAKKVENAVEKGLDETLSTHFMQGKLAATS
ncbi:MAG TPA: YihY family inner membrane protein [Noviherbaspirillum sp.]|uniref:YihY family inner membrane protein n=1 Tax=Noviherbaspirillum sp. TaxID=1926288 RepID=UPI002D4BA6D6|nr:YihY family inner membrane protein [Noviherbaspirillum sp.]HYD94643.1 YihY family inner membrane protein [Noviherbaspirillum sp.]